MILIVSDLQQSDYTHRCICVLSLFTHALLFAILWTGACGGPLSIGFSRQEYSAGLPFSSPGDVRDSRIKLCLLCYLHWQVDSFTSSATWEAPIQVSIHLQILFPSRLLHNIEKELPVLHSRSLLIALTFCVSVCSSLRWGLLLMIHTSDEFYEDTVISIYTRKSTMGCALLLLLFFSR